MLLHVAHEIICVRTLPFARSPPGVRTRLNFALGDRPWPLGGLAKSAALNLARPSLWSHPEGVFSIRSAKDLSLCKDRQPGYAVFATVEPPYYFLAPQECVGLFARRRNNVLLARSRLKSLKPPPPQTRCWCSVCETPSLRLRGRWPFRRHNMEHALFHGSLFSFSAEVENRSWPFQGLDSVGREPNITNG